MQNNDIEALHPDYLQRQLTEIRSEVSQGGSRGDARTRKQRAKIMARLAERLKHRTDAVADEIKRDDVHQALASGNRSITPEELNQATDKAAAATAKSALWLFITLLLGAIVSTAGGWWGVRSGDRYHVG